MPPKNKLPKKTWANFFKQNINYLERIEYGNDRYAEEVKFAKNSGKNAKTFIELVNNIHDCLLARYVISMYKKENSYTIKESNLEVFKEYRSLRESATLENIKMNEKKENLEYDLIYDAICEGKKYKVIVEFKSSNGKRNSGKAKNQIKQRLGEIEKSNEYNKIYGVHVYAENNLKDPENVKYFEKIIAVK